MDVANIFRESEMATSTRLGPWLVGTVRETAGRNLGATVVSQEVWVYQPTATAGSLPIYEVGVGGASFNGSAINIPNLGAAFQAPLVVPAGSRLNYFSVNIQSVPTVINNGAINLFIGATQIASYAVPANALTSGFATWQPTLAASQLQAMVGTADAQITAQLAGTGFVGSLLVEVSLNYTTRNPSGSILRLP